MEKKIKLLAQNDLANVDFDFDFDDIGEGFNMKMLDNIDENALRMQSKAPQHIKGNEIRKMDPEDLEEDLIEEMIYNISCGNQNGFAEQEARKIIKEIGIIKFFHSKKITNEMMNKMIKDYGKVNNTSSYTSKDIKYIIKELESLSLE